MSKILFATQEGIHGGVEIKTREEWIAQAKEAYAEWLADGWGGDVFTLREKAPATAFKLIQAFDACGQPFDAETTEWALEYGRTH